ncbi:MAG: NAD(P)/FAD-dependent oxidoreductase, partial [Thermoplasmata archaeon]|nr:NAD(P)/FAD-dependent oxidoreductase [Thermoplasmata archaeon]
KRAEELGTEFILEKTVVGLGGGGVKAGGTTGGVKAGGEVEGVKVGGVAVDGGERMGGGVAMDDGEKITSHLVIGCDGIESGIGRLSGLTKPLPLEDMGSAAQYRMEGDIWIEDTVDVFVGDKIAPGGYAWVFPKRGKLANVGAGVMGVGGHPPALTLLRRFVEERYPDARIVDTMAGCVPVGPPIDTAVKDNVMLAGDAARHAYAIAGGGIHSALWAGAMAGDAAGLFAQDKQRVHIREYDENWKAFMHKNLKKSYARKAKMYSSEKAMSRFMSGLKFAAPLIKYLPIDPLRLWWGKHDVS